MRIQTIYLAGPDVFLPDAVEIGRQKKDLCAEFGFTGLFPFDNELPPDVPRTERSRLIFQANEAMMSRADIIIANLTPFRGPSADVGTVYELGFMAGLGKPRLGYTNVAGDLRSRTAAADRAARNEGRGWVDGLGMFIEDFGNEDNLMITESLSTGGFRLVVHEVPAEMRLRDLTGFRECLVLVQRLR